jgi:sugar lactone lactonase YvrE
MQPTIDVLDIPPLALGEGAIWSPHEAAFYWLDIKGKRLYRLVWADRRCETFELPAEIGCMAPMGDGSIALATSDGLYRFRADAPLERLAAFDGGGAGHRSNDGAMDRQGRFWFSTIADPGAHDSATGRIWCCDRSGAIHPVLDGIFMPNGMAAAPDGETFYLSDSFTPVRRIWSFRFDDTGVGLADRKLFFDTAGRPGRPDGAAIDESGCYWMAGVSGSELVRITPEGRVDSVVALPVSHPTKPCFGGPDLDVLLLTTIQPAAVGTEAEPTPVPGGSVLVLRPGIKGLPQTDFILRA